MVVVVALLLLAQMALQAQLVAQAGMDRPHLFPARPLLMLAAVGAWLMETPQQLMALVALAVAEQAENPQ